MKESVIRIAGHYKDRLGEVRTIPGWKAASEGDVIWLKGPLENGNAQIAINSLPAAATYLADEQYRLFPLGKQTPVLELKDLQWQNLEEFITVEQPVSAMPGLFPQAITFKLIRSTNPEQPAALITSFKLWEGYLKTAPLIRLQQLQYAVASDELLVVMGVPLPPLKGETFWRYKNILLPSGYTFDPPIIADLLDGDDLLLFHADGQCDKIPFDAFNAAERNLVV
jgi:hypothetical protein